VVSLTILYDKECIKSTTLGMFKYIHIYSHADKKRKWSELPLPEQVNVHCDYSAGVARRGSIGKVRDTVTQTEPLRVFLARKQAKDFYVSELKWSIDSFDEVDWEALNFTLANKNMMFTLVWLAKQASSFCGTRLQVSRMSEGGADDRCPNCLAPEKDLSI
jgi:hypothetical protein